jgi:hypothetical protein
MYARSYHSRAGNRTIRTLIALYIKEAVMNRREFLVNAGIALLALPAISTLTGCGKSSSDNTPVPANSFRVESSLDVGHTHNIDFPLTDFVNPSGSKTYTSDGATHVHTLTLTQQQLTDINNGTTVGPIVSSNVGGHTHTWTIKKP